MNTQIKVKLPTSFSTITLWDKCKLSFAFKALGQKRGAVNKALSDGNERHRLMNEFGKAMIEGLSMPAAKDRALSVVRPTSQRIIYEFKRVAIPVEFDEKVKLESQLTANEAFTGPGGFFLGIVDYIRVEPPALRIIDYKGRWDSPEYRFQLELYCALAQANFDGISDFAGRTFHVPSNRFSEDSFIQIEDPSALRENIASWLKGKISEIESTDPARIEGTIGGHCKICSYRHVCPNMLIARPNVEKVNLHNLSGEELEVMKMELKEFIAAIDSLLDSDEEGSEKPPKKQLEERSPMDVLERLEEIGVAKTAFNRAFRVNWKAIHGILGQFGLKL